MTAIAQQTVTKILAAVAVKSELAELARRFETAGNHPIEMTYDLNPAVLTRMMAGEHFDLIITNPWYVSELIQTGLADAASHAAFGRVPLAIGARTGHSGPVLTTQHDIRALLLQASSIGYTAEGTSGKTFLALAERMQIRDDILQRAVPMKMGQSVLAVARGETDLAIAPLSSIVNAADVDPVAIFPSDLGGNIDLSICRCTASTDPARSQSVITFLCDPTIDPYLQSRGIVRFHLS